MPAGTKAHQLAEVCQVGAALIILSFKPGQIDQQLAWSWLTCIGGNRHVSSPLTVLTLRHRVRSLENIADVADTGSSWIGAFIRFFPYESTNLGGAEPDLKRPLPICGV